MERKSDPAFDGVALIYGTFVRPGGAGVGGSGFELIVGTRMGTDVAPAVGGAGRVAVAAGGT